MFVVEDWMKTNEIAIKICKEDVLKQSTNV